MGSEKRARQKANRAAKVARLEVEETKEVREASTKKWGRIVAIVGGLVALIFLISFFRGGDDDDVVQFGPSEEVTPTVEPTPIVLADAVPADFEPFAGERALAGVTPAARDGAYSSPPPMTIDVTKTYLAIIDTDVGDISFELFPAESPNTVNNFVSLARDGFYDGVVFHRVIEGSSAESGDPTGTGDGGPGYQFDDESDNALLVDRAGLLVMNHDGPDTNGSQFIITFGPDTDLSGVHTVFGEVARDEETLDAIVRQPESINDATVINQIRILES